MDLHKQVCSMCAETFILLYALFESSEEKLSWLDISYVFKKGSQVDDSDNSDVDDCDEA
jgi:hypothetical protein